jgi:uracil-DNA glycosylase
VHSYGKCELQKLKLQEKNSMLNQTADTDWNNILKDAFAQESYEHLIAFLEEENQRKIPVLPPFSQVFACFEHTPFHQVKVVIIGQDPYHGLNQAHGLSFSVNEGVKIPPSLKNIFKALQYDMPDYQIPKHGNLNHWAKQGVLLLNTVLTVRENQAGSHQNKGWEQFTNIVIEQLSRQKDHIVFLLWGNAAKLKKELIDANKHLILEAPHPSPLSAHKGFLTCKHFSQTNHYLQAHKLKAIDW